MTFRKAAMILLATSGAGWLGYRAGLGPDQAEAMWAAREKPAATRQRPDIGGAGASARKNAAELLREFQARDPGSNNPLVQLEGWEKIRAFSAEQCREALAVIPEKSAPSWGNPWSQMLYFRWAELAPDAAMKEVMKLPERTDPYLRQTVMAAWFKNDPEAAYRWSKSEPKLAGDFGASEMMGAVLLSEPLPSAMAKAKLLDKRTQERVFSTSGTIAGRDTPEAREAFLMSLDPYDEESRQIGLKSLLRSWSQQEPREVLERWDEFGYRDKDARFSEKDNLLFRWGSREPEQALAWIDQNPQSAGKPQQIDIYQRWVDDDPEAASRWLEGRENAGEYAAELVKQSHSATLKRMGHSARVQTMQRREEALRQHYALWARQQPQEAAAWLQSIDSASAAKIKGGDHAAH